MTRPDVAERIRDAYARRAQRGIDARHDPAGPAARYIHETRERALLSLLRRHGFLELGRLRILDIGCGEGASLRALLRLGATPAGVAGVDLLRERVMGARSLPAPVAVCVADAGALPFADGTVDLALAFTLLSSIPDAEARARAAREAVRVLRPGGMLVVYDFWINPLNRDVRPLRARELRRLFAGCHLDMQRVTLAPPLVRVLARRCRWACAALDRLPWLRTHYLTAVRKPPIPAAPAAGGSAW